MQNFYRARLMDHTCPYGLSLVLIVISGFSATSPCLPVEIGQHIQLDCPCQSQRSNMNWETMSVSGKKITVNACDKVSTLTLHRLSKLHVTNNQSHSSLSLSHVTTEDMNRKIQCTKNGRTLNDPPICSLQVFHKPEAPFCFTEITGRSSARFTCKTPKVFPGLECNLVYKSTHQRTAEVEVKPEIVRYNLTAINSTHPTYLKGVCFAEILDIDPGEYQLFGVLRPNVAFVYNSSVPARPTPVFVIYNTSDAPTITSTSGTTGSPSLGYVTIQKQGVIPTSLCHDSAHNFTVYCEASEFGSLLMLKILLNYKNKGQYVHVELKSADNASTISASFLADVWHQDTYITCFGETPFGTVSNQTELGVQWLPKLSIEARLVPNNETIIDGIHADGSAIFVFTCGVNEDANFNILYFHVKCVAELDLDIVLEKEYVDSNLKLILNLNKVNGLVRCSCSGIHRKGCYVQGNHFKIEISKHESIVSNNVLNFDPLLIVGVTVTLTVLILVIITCKCRHRLQTCFASSSSFESHIYEDIEDPLCSPGCFEYFTKRCSSRSHKSCAVGRGRIPGVHVLQTVTPLLHLNPSPIQPQAEFGHTVNRSNKTKRVSPYENVLNI
ncbi:unnamed protein product [Lymnaea stagnalis]|uniref:Ig-like domain-containing protein n=1 Tax=Lymnaea stagnalis TaxID=6523 RepID=A0AAV2HSN2_LYMST